MMSQEYFFDFSNSCDLTVKIADNVKNVYSKQCKDYGEINAKNTLKRVQGIFTECLDIVNNSNNKNILLVGKVQSGKTSNLELFVSFAFDNGYNVVIVYGGYDTKLLQQTSDRFKRTFNINENESIKEDIPELFSTDDNEINTIDENVLTTILEYRKPIILVAMKRPSALKKINSILELLRKHNIKSFIIDDEGDQASLNTEFKKNKESSTYHEIKEMKKILKNPLYLSVTATPQANVLLGEYSELKPYKIFTIEPGSGYTGAEYFHLDDEHIVNIDNGDLHTNSNDIPKSMYNSIDYFIIASAIIKITNGIEYTDMIIHTDRSNNKHSKTYLDINNYISSLKDDIKNTSKDFDKQLEKIKELYSPLYFKKEIIDKYPFKDITKGIIDVIINTHLILQNSQGSITQGNEKYKFHKIYVGGDLLQRGLTFKNLIVTYFTRWAKKNGNMDTVMQRARWFGYRSKYLDYCKIFTTKQIRDEYAALTESEKDLWEQCYLIQNGELSIEDIVIDANSSSLNPTRRNVVEYDKVKIGNKWVNQRIGFFDSKINDFNKEFIKKIFEEKDFKDSNIGRTKLSNQPTCKYAFLSKDEALNLICNSCMIFDCRPFDKRLLVQLFEKTDKKIIVERMFTDEKPIRVRTFDKDTGEIVSILQQGPDTADETSKKYMGDSYVIVDRDAIIMQMYKIRPRYGKDLDGQKQYDQYMFSIHTPNERRGFVKK